MAQFKPGNKAAQGRGRPPKAERFARPIATAEKWIADRLPELVELKMELARGVKVQDADGNVYQRPPDGKAIEYLIDRIMGKPTERREHEVDHRGEVGTYVVNIGEEDDSGDGTTEP